MRLSEIAKALNAEMRGNDVEILSVGTDSRNIAKGQLFVAIKGEHFDGNAYAADAIKNGAAAALVAGETVPVSPAVMVKDTRLALGELAHYWRKKFDLPLVAVTGSNGKTTVKEMITAIINADNGKALATRGNLNNDIGMPLTLLNINTNHTNAVIEMGMNHEGEIRYLTKIAAPTVALITNAGTAHIGELGSREAIARAKGEIFEGLVDGGVAIVNDEDDFASYWKSLNTNRKMITFGVGANADVSASYEAHTDYSLMSLKTSTGNVRFKLPLLGRHNVQNALAASAVAVALGIKNENIATGLENFSSVKGRLNRLEGLSGAEVIDDTYNANPDSMKAAIDVLAEQDGVRIFVMGDMAELGETAAQMHAEMGAYAKQKGVAHFLTVGDLSRLASEAFGTGAQHFDSIESLVKKLTAQLNPNVTALVKGSRFMKMERVVIQITKQKQVMGAH